MIEVSDLTGHWRRDWLEVPGRHGDRRAPRRRDTTTEVHWLQAPGGYVDLRVPAGLERLRGAAPAELPPADLAALMEAEGFAGTIAVADGVCTWTRAIDWHGASERPDVGRLSWDADGALIETGAHADYAERWLREPGGAMRSRVWGNGARRLRLVWSDAALALGIGEPGAPSTAPRDAPAHGERPAGEIERRFRGEFTFARWDGERAVATLSTHPMRVGETILTRSDLGARRLGLTRRDARGHPLEEAWSPHREG